MRLTKRCNDIEDKIKTAVKLPDFEAVKKQLERAELAIAGHTKRYDILSSEIRSINERLALFQCKTSKELLAKELYDKRFNILVYGMEENLENAWETKYESERKFRNFLRDALKIPESHTISIADVHRLPQHSVSKNGERIHRPIIAKLTSYADKNLVMRSLNKLKNYNNDKKKRLGDNVGYVYVTEHLPREVLQQKKLLLPVHKKAKEERKRAVWKIEQATYCLYIDNIKYVH